MPVLPTVAAEPAAAAGAGTAELLLSLLIEPLTPPAAWLLVMTRAGQT